MESQTEIQAPPTDMERVIAAAPSSELPPTYETISSPIFGQPLGPKPMQLTCRNCNEVVITRVEMRVSFRTHFIAGLCCILGGVILAWIPYYADKGKSKDHYCPNCETFIGTGIEWPYIR